MVLRAAVFGVGANRDGTADALLAGRAQRAAVVGGAVPGIGPDCEGLTGAVQTGIAGVAPRPGRAAAKGVGADVDGSAEAAHAKLAGLAGLVAAAQGVREDLDGVAHAGVAPLAGGAGGYIVDARKGVGAQVERDALSSNAELSGLAAFLEAAAVVRVKADENGCAVVVDADILRRTCQLAGVESWE